MTKDEKIYLIKCLLEDIRMNWATTTIPRATKAKELCEELGGEFLKLADTCNDYIRDSDHMDGRFFRDEFPFGYENMEKLYNLTHTLYDKSEEFQSIVNELITYPEFAFDDVENKWW